MEKVSIEKKPFLGICVGMQMLATKGFENGEFMGLDWIEGNVKKLKKTRKHLKIPHMGWNNLEIKKENIFIKKLKKKLIAQKYQPILFIVTILKQKILIIKLCQLIMVKR